MKGNMMMNWSAFGKAMMSLFLAIFIPVSQYTNLIVVHDEPVTITTALVSCETKTSTSGGVTKTTIYFEIDQFPYRLYYIDPAKFQEALLQRCEEKDRVNLIYRRVYPRLSDDVSYKLYGMESLTDGQIVLTPADIEADRDRDRCLIYPTVIFLLGMSFLYLTESTVPEPNYSRDTERIRRM